MRRLAAAVPGLAVAGALLVLLALLGWLGYVLVTGGLDSADKVGSVVGAALATAGPLVGLGIWARKWSERTAATRAAAVGRGAVLPLIGEAGAEALKLRVHPALDGGVDEHTGPVDTGGRPGRRSRRPVGDPEWPDLPTFVPRDKQAEIERWLRRARTSGGALLLVGDSAVGKSRLLYELAKSELADYHVFAPSLGSTRFGDELATWRARYPKLLVWLDEMQRFLPGPQLTPGSDPLTAERLKTLLDGRVIVLGSCWPEHLSELRDTVEEPRPSGDSGGGPPRRRDKHPAAADVLRSCHDVRIGSFSADERAAANRLASADPRLREALAHGDYGVTQVLAGAPRLIQHYLDGGPRLRAVVAAAVDATRLGVESPLSARTLCGGAGGYLDDPPAGDTWFAPALAKATEPILSTSLLTLERDEDSDAREELGYRVASFVRQHVGRERARARVPDSLWRALLDDVSHPADLRELAFSALDRGLVGYYERAARRAAEAGDADAQTAVAVIDAYRAGDDELPSTLHRQRAAQLAERGDLDALRRLADDDSHAALELAGLLHRRGGRLELEQRTDYEARSKLAELLLDRDAVEELSRLADLRPLGPEGARLADVLCARRQLHELKRLADGGNFDAQGKYADVLAWRGDWAEMEDRARRGEFGAPSMIALRSLVRADLDGIRALAEQTGAAWAGMALAHHLVDRDELDELRARADGGDSYCAERLAHVLCLRGQDEELRARADRGDHAAGRRYARMAMYRGEFSELRDRSRQGDIAAAAVLTDVLIATGGRDELRALAAPGSEVSRRYAGFLAHHSEVDELRDRALSGHRDAADVLSDFLADRHDVDALTALAPQVEEAAARLVRLRAARLDDATLGEVTRRAAQGDQESLRTLAEALAARGDLEGLRRWTPEERSDLRGLRAIGTRFEESRYDREQASSYFTSALVRILVARCELDELRGLLRGRRCDDRVVQEALDALMADGVEAAYPAGPEGPRMPVQLLVCGGDLDGLRARVEAGDADAARALASVMVARGELDGLRHRADRELSDAAEEAPFAEAYADVLACRRDIAQLEARSETGDQRCFDVLEWILVARDDGIEAIRTLSERVVGLRDTYVAAVWLSNPDGLEQLFEAGGPEIHDLMRSKYVDLGLVEELAELAESGDAQAAEDLVRVLWRRGDLDALRERADTGDRFAARYYFDMLQARGETDELRRRADHGDVPAAMRLVPLLSVAGDVDGLCREIDAGTPGALAHLAILLDERGDTELATRLRRYGMRPGRRASRAAIADEPMVDSS